MDEVRKLIHLVVVVVVAIVRRLLDDAKVSYVFQLMIDGYVHEQFVVIDLTLTHNSACKGVFLLYSPFVVFLWIIRKRVSNNVS
jgi:hypothetical protein